MIPDKIYIGSHNDNVQTGYFSRNKDYVFTQEFIRKDALMEWLNNRIIDGDEEGLMTNQIANLAYKDVIEKLNEL